MRQASDDVIPGKWYDAPKGLKLACCDCGLVHVVEIKKAKGRFAMRLWRDNRSTAATRRYNKFEKQ
jgi:hypothetical protein